MADQIFYDSNADSAFKAKRFAGRAVIYGILILWALIASVPNLLDHHHQLQDGPRRDEREYRPLLGLYPEMVGLAVTWAFA